MRVIYLDQMKWIELANTIHNGGNPEAEAIVQFIRVAKSVGQARYAYRFRCVLHSKLMYWRVLGDPSGAREQHDR